MNIRKLIISSLFLLLILPLAAQVNTVQKYEYWIDQQYDQRKTIQSTETTFNTTLDFGSAPEGIHSISYRIQDSKGRWSSPIMRYFLNYKQNYYPDNATSKYEYWIDGDYDNAVSGAFNGNMMETIDCSNLCFGAHTFAYRISDKYGKWSSPILKFFVIPEPSLVGNQIVAYEYFFNQGHAVHVDVNPQNPFTLNDLWVDIKDVTPNEIPADYVYDVSSQTVWCKDSVHFGLKIIDKLGNKSLPVISKNFFMNVPVKLNVIPLVDSIATDFTPPDAGEIAAFSMKATVGDSLRWHIDRGTCTIDFYDANGVRITPDMDDSEKPDYRTIVNTEQTYALVHHASAGIMKTMSIICSSKLASGIQNSLTSGIIYSTNKGMLVIDSPAQTTISIYDLMGRLITKRTIASGVTRIPLPSNIYLLKTTDSKVVKINIR